MLGVSPILAVILTIYHFDMHHAVPKPKTMNTAIVLLVVLVILMQSCEKSLIGIRGKGKTVSNAPTIDGTIKGIDLSVTANVHYIKSDSQYVQIDAQQNIYNNMALSMNNEVLHVEYEKNVRKHEPVHIYIHSPECHTVQLSGSGTIHGDSVFTSEHPVSIKISGSGSVNLSISAPAVSIHISDNGKIIFFTKTENLNAYISGAGNMTATGTAEDASFNISGSGNVNAHGLTTQNCNVKVSGAGNIKVATEKQLDVKVSDEGNVKYKGNATVTTDISGSGDVKHQ